MESASTEIFRAILTVLLCLLVDIRSVSSGLLVGKYLFLLSSKLANLFLPFFLQPIVNCLLL